MKARGAVLALVAVCSGCATAQFYDGPRRDPDDVAHISGDLRVTAGAPVSVILRQVDGRPLGFGQNAVEVLPGKHELLVDCQIAETGGVSRHTIEAEVWPGRRYRLRAETGAGLRQCTDVTLESV
jgi:hypothetical protein